MDPRARMYTAMLRVIYDAELTKLAMQFLEGHSYAPEVAYNVARLETDKQMRGAALLFEETAPCFSSVAMTPQLAQHPDIAAVVADSILAYAIVERADAIAGGRWPERFEVCPS